MNFHSFRRWFITKAIQAGQPELVVQIVVGHKPQSITAGTYLEGLTIDQMRDCVEAVKLPSSSSPVHPGDDQGQLVLQDDDR